MTLVEDLLADDPNVHTELAKGRAITYGADPGVLRWLAETVQPDWRTLETGCGLSTVVFAAAGSDHVAIAPFPDEWVRVQAWAGKRNISTARVRFIDAHSEWVLPKMEHQDLDLVLVDGSHAFPQVFIDYFYAAPSSRSGVCS